MTTTDTPPTARQAEVLRAIAAHQEENGRPPTIRELMTALGIKSTNGLVCHLRPLARRGLIEYGSNTSRGIRLVGARLVLRFEEGEAGDRLREALGVPAEAPAWRVVGPAGEAASSHHSPAAAHAECRRLAAGEGDPCTAAG